MTATRAATESTKTGDRRIVAHGVTRRFGKKTALHPTDLDLGPGGIIGLLGPNGSGKSTLLRILVGLVRPDAGTARIDGVALASDGTAIRRRATYTPGELALYKEMRAAEHLDWFLRGREAAARVRARAIASALGLPLAARVRTFSHGMKRQLMFAAALAPDVGVRILDEPTEGLDPTKRGVVLDLLHEDARTNGTTILLSSHHLGEVDRACDRLVFIADGRKIADETPASLARRAGRVLRIEFPGDTDREQLTRTLEHMDGAQLSRLETTPNGALRASLMLAADDPRAFTAAVLTHADLPRPTAFEYGQLSLVELYRELYGVEGC
ncbi:MAG: ABC transporter ATP-binding protein [Planctomycetes bacterium]|nr:ABC transporter ATP-binding protein [Planctomycetota bacterium]